MDIFIDSNRTSVADKKIDQDVSGIELQNHLFLRLVAKGKKFTKVNFRYSILDNCYLRNCVFGSCDFTGCKFIGSNLRGSSFVGCTFDYSTFERTNITNDILDTECPSHENLKQFFARSLRTNYQQIGDSISVNKAIQIELQATGIHLLKEWTSKEPYYREKYKGINRAKSFLRWIDFKFLDIVWGNGESLSKMTLSVIFILIFITCFDVIIQGKEVSLPSIFSALCDSLAIFLGNLKPESYPNFYLSIITFVRLITLGFLISIIIKRFNRR